MGTQKIWGAWWGGRGWTVPLTTRGFQLGMGAGGDGGRHTAPKPSGILAKLSIRGGILLLNPNI